MRNQLFLGAAVAALVMPAVAGAQETTSIIRGTVVSAGAPVAGAKITITHVPSGTRSTSTTDGNGSFAANGLRVGGPYTVEVSSDKGTTSISGIYTVVQQPYDLPIDLGGDAAASGAAEIVVTAASIKGAGVTSDGPQTILTQADIAKVASVNRDIRDIERRDPFANIDLSNGGDRGGAVSFAGVNPRFNRFTINGVTVGDTFGLNQDASPTNRGPVPFDALAQVSVSIAPYDFRQSGFQGGAIDTVLASGTNRFHGTGFYSQNTDGLSGDRIGNTTIVNPKYKSETYGATLSGPNYPRQAVLPGFGRKEHRSPAVQHPGSAGPRPDAGRHRQRHVHCQQRLQHRRWQLVGDQPAQGRKDRRPHRLEHHRWPAPVGFVHQCL